MRLVSARVPHRATDCPVTVRGGRLAGAVAYGLHRKYDDRAHTQGPCSIESRRRGSADAARGSRPVSSTLCLRVTRSTRAAILTLSASTNPQSGFCIRVNHGIFS